MIFSKTAHPFQKSGIAFLLALSLLAITACGSASTIEKPLSSALNDYYDQKLNWDNCYQDFECADLKVPIDYENLTTGTFKIAVLRYPAAMQNKKLGSLIINPGGPGASGVDYAYNAEYIFNPDILDRYDIVGFDPRGVARSAPIKCFTDAESDANFAADTKPDNAEELAKAIADAKSFIAKCEAKVKYLDSYSTANAARDMDILREVLGDKKLNYLGKSYGTYMGALYAQLFPDKVGRMVLDGAVDPSVSQYKQSLQQAIGFETAVTAFIVNCLKLPSCPLAKTPEEAQTEIINLLAKAAANPLPRKTEVKGDSRLATESIVVLGMANAMYDNTEGWPQLRTAIRQGLEGYGDTFLTLADNYTGRAPDGTFRNNELDSGTIIDCIDSTDPRTIEEITADKNIFATKAPIFGPYLAYGGLTCKFFTNSHTPTKVTQTTNTAPVIIIGTIRDPATPYEWAAGLRAQINNSRLISLDADGHTGQGRGSACVDDAVDTFYLTGNPPKKDLSCRL